MGWHAVLQFLLGASGRRPRRVAARVCSSLRDAAHLDLADVGRRVRGKQPEGPTAGSREYFGVGGGCPGLLCEMRGRIRIRGLYRVCDLVLKRSSQLPRISLPPPWREKDLVARLQQLYKNAIDLMPM